MHSRKWLEEELALHRKPADNCWETHNPFGHSCVGYMKKAQSLFNETKSKEDLAQWKLAVDRAEEYVKIKYAKYYAPLKPARFPEAKAAATEADPEHAKTNQHLTDIANERVLIANGEELIKNLGLAKHTAIIEANKANYETTQDKEALTTWKASLDATKQYLKEIKRDKSLLDIQTDEYNSAEKEYNKKHSSISRYTFWCCGYKSADRSEKNKENQRNDDPSGTSYMRLPGQ